MRLDAIPRALVLLVLFVSAPLAPSSAEDALSYQTFRARYHCEIVQRLALLKARKGAKDRFIIVSLKLHPDHFTQCMFHPDGMRVLCEASSGFFSRQRLGSKGYTPTAETVTALGQLGFSTDMRKGNFQREMEATTIPQISAIADLLLSSLYNGYGARAFSPIIIHAPLAPLKPSEQTRCVPLS